MSEHDYNFTNDPCDVVIGVYIWLEGHEWGFPVEWHTVVEEDEQGEYLMAYPELFTTRLTFDGRETTYERFKQSVGINAYDVYDMFTAHMDELYADGPLDPHDIKVDFDVTGKVQ